MGKGLDARWTLTEAHDQEKGADVAATSEDMRSYNQAELDCIEKYTSATFEDTKLQELALSYVNSLKALVEGADSYSSSDVNSLLAYNELIEDRRKILNEILSSELYRIPGHLT